MPCQTCSGASGHDGADGANGVSSGICVKCLTFWIIVALISFGILAHRHGAGGKVYF
jgi:hypothetical protein